MMYPKIKFRCKICGKIQESNKMRINAFQDIMYHVSLVHSSFTIIEFDGKKLPETSNDIKEARPLIMLRNELQDQISKINSELFEIRKKYIEEVKND